MLSEPDSPASPHAATDHDDKVSGFQILRGLEQTTMRYAMLMSWLAMISIVLAVADVELTVVRQPQQALTLLFGGCRTPKPSLLVRSGHSFAGIEDILAFAPFAMPASPPGALGFGPSWATSTNTQWADAINSSSAALCGSNSLLPAGTGGEPCSFDASAMAAILLGVADRRATQGTPSLKPRSWSLMLGTHKDCLAGTRSRSISSFGGANLPTAASMAIARGRTLSAAALSTGIGAATWPASGFAGTERASVLIPSSRLLALEGLGVSLATAVLVEQGAIAASSSAAGVLRSDIDIVLMQQAWTTINNNNNSSSTSVLGATATASLRVWRHALARFGLHPSVTPAHVVEMSDSMQHSLSIRARSFTALATSYQNMASTWPEHIGLSVVATSVSANATAALRRAIGNVAPSAYASLAYSPVSLTGLSGDDYKLFANVREVESAASALPAELWGSVRWMGRGGFGASPLSSIPDTAAAAAAVASGAAQVGSGGAIGLDLAVDELNALEGAVHDDSALVGAVWGVRAAQSGLTAALCLLTVLWHLAAVRVRLERGQNAQKSGICRVDHAISDILSLIWRSLALPCSQEACNGCVRMCPRLCPERSAQLSRREKRHKKFARRMRQSLITEEPLLTPHAPHSMPAAAPSTTWDGSAVKRVSVHGNEFQHGVKAGRQRSNQTQVPKHTLKAARQTQGSLCQWVAFGQLVAELLLVVVHMPIGVWPQAEAAIGPSVYVGLSLAPVLLRIHMPMRVAFLTSDLGTGSGRLIVALSGQTFSASFFLKRRLRESAWATVVGIIVFFITFASIGLHATETLSCSAERVPACVPLSLAEAVYLVAISVTTVGFGGRYAPRTTFGSVLVIMACGMSLIATAVAVAELVRFMRFGAAEEQVTSLTKKAGLRTSRKRLAAAAIQAAWHWSLEHRQSLLWTKHAVKGLVFRSSASRAAATLRATGAVAAWAAFRAVAGRSLLDADMGPRRRLLAAFTLLRVDEAKELLVECLVAAEAAQRTVTAGLPNELRAKLGLFVPGRGINKTRRRSSASELPNAMFPGTGRRYESKRFSGEGYELGGGTVLGRPNAILDPESDNDEDLERAAARYNGGESMEWSHAEPDIAALLRALADAQSRMDNLQSRIDQS